MLRFEIKKIFSKRINKLMLMVLIAVTIVGSLLAIRDVKYYTDQGNKISGPAAARQLKMEKNRWQGYLTEDVIKQVVEENKEAKASSAMEDDALIKRQGIEDIREIINRGFAEPGEYDYYLCDNISPEKAAGLYEQRLVILNKDLGSGNADKAGFSQNEKEFLRDRYKDMNAPLYYEYMDGWKALLDSQYLPTLMIITIVIIGFLISGIFSDEFQFKADSIFFSSELGRNKAVTAKLKAGFITITAVYWGVMLLFSIIILAALGFGGAECMIQAGGNWNSIYNITYFQNWLFTMLGGYAAHLFILTLAMFISAKSRSTVIAITIPFALSCAPMFLGRVPMFTDIMSMFPDMLLRMCAFLEDLLVCEIFGKVFGLYTVLIPVYLLLSFVIAGVLYRNYRKAEVR
ncbi:MAG: ABC transporter permease [Firmicutes bacterium]|nr:ABC transporter permease [Bacillota bacterium]